MTDCIDFSSLGYWVWWWGATAATNFGFKECVDQGGFAQTSFTY